ncbi:hypothetical protein TRVA0_030S00386 [Trichomonascus vanleenenianus]|uniref:ATP synthase subunit epsilon family protein n=1 Tax=Trichomonascus vanleenenianus TaxID=2268995 RepID=UPI003ECABE3C
MPASYWRSAGFTYNRYAAVGARILRLALKEDKRVTQERLNRIDTKAARWEKGQQLEPELLSVTKGDH